MMFPERQVMDMKILEVQDLCKAYGKGEAGVQALDHVSFSVEKGEFIAIMGASGSGKSTLLNVIATIDRISSGDICINGKHIQNMRENELSAFRRDQLGFVFQEYNLLDTLTISENIVLPLNLKREGVHKTNQRLSKIAGALNIESQLSKFPYELSGGQRQRAACARAIITNPSLILADEPTGALDSRAADELLRLFAAVNKTGQTILMVTHSTAAASRAGRVLFIKDGEVFHQIYRGDDSDEDLYKKISYTLTVLMTGGDRR